MKIQRFRFRSILLLIGISGLLSGQGEALASVTTYSSNLAGFNAAAGATSVFGFDSITPGTDIGGSTISGMTFTSPDGNTLTVVRGTDTFTPAGFSGVIDASTNKLFPTSGENVLSPGGVALVPGPTLAEQDSLAIAFPSPVSAFGIDVLFQSLDAAPFVEYALYNSANGLITSGSVPGNGAGGGAPGSFVFMGFVSNSASTNIGRIVFTDSDGNSQFPDSNVGYDTIRVTSMIPEPESYAMLLAGLGLVGFMARRRRQKLAA